MGIQVADNFSLKSKKPLDGRTQYATLAEMKAVPDASLYEGCKAYVVATDKYYKYKSTNTVDETLGKWREDKSGGAVDSVNGKTGVVVLNASDVGALPDDTDIPSNTSDLTNDSGFITNTVNNLLNYYLKSETYTQAEVNALISAIVTLDIQAVLTLPTEDISRTTIYLVPSSDPQTQNIKDEYINLDGTSSGWELIGSTEIDLTGYVTDTELTTALADYTTTANLTTLLNGKVDKVIGKQLSTEDYTTAEKTKLASLENIQVSTMPTANASNEGDIVQYVGPTTSDYINGHFYKCVTVPSSIAYTTIKYDHDGDAYHTKSIYASGLIYSGSSGPLYVDEDCTQLDGGSYVWNSGDSSILLNNVPITYATGGRGNVYAPASQIIRHPSESGYGWEEIEFGGGSGVTDFDDLTNRPQESDTIDISDLDLPMPSKPTEYPVLFDETGKEYQVGLYKRASDGKVKPVYKKTIQRDAITTTGAWVKLVELGTTCVIQDVKAYYCWDDFSIKGILNFCSSTYFVISTNTENATTKTNGTIIGVTTNGSLANDKLLFDVYFTKTTDSWKEA